MKSVFLLFYLLSLSMLVYTQPPTSTDPSYYYNLCAPSPCNNLILSYPFSLPTPCHPPSLNTQCTINQNFLLNNPTSTDTFRVLSVDHIDPTLVSLVVASDSLFTCGSQISRPEYSYGNNILFTLASLYAIGTHFNCTAPILSSSIPGLQNATCLGCENQDPFNFCYYAPRLLRAIPNCEMYFITALANSSFNASRNDLRGFLQSGFQGRYAKPPWCIQCEVSGGRCGASPLSGSFVCFCPLSVHPTNCTDGMEKDLSDWGNPTKIRGRRLANAAVAVMIIAASALLLLVVGIVTLIRWKRQMDTETSISSQSSF